MATAALAGCGACHKKAVTPAPIAVAPAPAPAPAPPPPPPDMAGFWAEYWSPQGRAETQRYVFLADGRFGWLAPVRDTPKVEPLQRSGHFSFDNGDLVLQIEHQRFGDGRVEELATPLREAIEIGECPPNQEAQAVDAAYACRSLAGRAFWHRAAADASGSTDPEPFLH